MGIPDRLWSGPQRNIALRQQGRLDEGRIWAELTPLLELKGAPDAAERLRRIFADAQD
jgi:hypothetical protein